MWETPLPKRMKEQTSCHVALHPKVLFFILANKTKKKHFILLCGIFLLLGYLYVPTRKKKFTKDRVNIPQTRGGELL